MGQMISGLIDSVDHDEEKQKLASDALTQMQEMGQQQIDYFQQFITNSAANDKRLPIDMIIHQDSIVRCSISSKPYDIGKEIGTSFGQFAKGALAAGLETVVSSGIKALVGSYEGNKALRDTYAITTGDLGGIQRVDIRMFAWKYSSKQLMDITKDVVAVAVVVSSVRAKDIDISTVRTLVQEQYSDVSAEERKQILNLILAAKKEEQSEGG
ncbi:uncharacterized protein F5Z01DRAFT_687370 [Emericellopsis atlantica]|uniref:Uncharacterized protein n=1 Tax=Emericellopsis atlantica TaxID=2614577 RepID=A0A9P7ZMS5_9HYPO|nr:uncharacterized protein F5Z01DRAFT_687370 [Emericellopsis atlantica]KAG9254541.1 hypothetical protein F5Z01DRAFT_687370 [Emericellopsis atlantica]